jgi:hypothetical protein
MDPLFDEPATCWRAYDTTYGGIQNNYVDSLTYAFKVFSPYFSYVAWSLMPPDGGIVRCKPKVIGEVM